MTFVSAEIVYIFLKISIKPLIVHSSSDVIQLHKVAAKFFSCLVKIAFSISFFIDARPSAFNAVNPIMQSCAIFARLCGDGLFI